MSHHGGGHRADGSRLQGFPVIQFVFYGVNCDHLLPRDGNDQENNRVAPLHDFRLLLCSRH